MTDKNIPDKKPSENMEKYRIPSAYEFRDVEYISQKNRRKNIKNSKKKTHRINVSGILFGMLYGSALIALVLLMLIVINTMKTNDNNIVNPTQGGNDQPFINETKEPYIRINSDSCTLCLGQQISLSVSAYPSELAYVVTWTSNNEDVVYVDYDGAVIVTGEGIAVVSACSGNLVDAITIEVVANKNVATSLGLPFYSKVDDPAFIGNNNPVQPGSEEETYPSHEYETEPSGEVTFPYEPEPESESLAEPVTQPTHEDVTSPSAETKPVHETEEETPTVPVQPTKPVPEMDVEGIKNILSACGFEHHLDNTYVYRPDGVYYGEIIVDTASVQIYIKNRTTEFDSAIKGILSFILPKTADIAWSSFLNARSDATISCEGRKVRFVMPGKNAHTQIVVYNP